MIKRYWHKGSPFPSLSISAYSKFSCLNICWFYSGLANTWTAYLISVQWQIQQQEQGSFKKCGVVLAFIPRIKLSSFICPFKNQSTADLYLVFNFLFAYCTPPWDNSNPAFLMMWWKIFLWQVFVLIMCILPFRDTENCDNYPGGSFIFFTNQRSKMWWY